MLQSASKQKGEGGVRVKVANGCQSMVQRFEVLFADLGVKSIRLNASGPGSLSREPTTVSQND